MAHPALSRSQIHDFQSQPVAFRTASSPISPELLDFAPAVLALPAFAPIDLVGRFFALAVVLADLTT